MCILFIIMKIIFQCILVDKKKEAGGLHGSEWAFENNNFIQIN